MKDLKNDCIFTMSLCSQAYSRCPAAAREMGQYWRRTHLVPVALTSFSLLEEGPYEGVYNVGLVLLQPMTGSRNNVETEMIPDVETAGLSHLLLQEGVSLTPQQQDWRSDMVLAQGQGAMKINSLQL